VLVIGGSQAVNTQKSVEAEQFVVRDKDGRERARIGLRESGDFEFLASDQNGKVRMRMDLLVDGTASFRLNDGAEKGRLSLRVDPDGNSSLSFRDKSQDVPLFMSADSEGTPRLGLSDREGKTRLALYVGSDGIPGIDLYRKDGPGLSITENDRQLPRLFFFDADGVRSGIVVKEGGESALFFVGKNHESQIELGNFPDGRAFLVIKDKDGKSVFVAPSFNADPKAPEGPKVVQRGDGEQRPTTIVDKSHATPFLSLRRDHNSPGAAAQSRP
jgi:hypothetical protein